MSNNPFEILDSINNTKENMMTEQKMAEKDYPAFMINRGLSLFVDTIMPANQMNMSYILDRKIQYEYLLAAVRKRKRYSKWPKKIIDSEIIELIQRDFDCSVKRAIEIDKLLTEEDKEKLRELYND